MIDAISNLRIEADLGLHEALEMDRRWRAVPQETLEKILPLAPLLGQWSQSQLHKLLRRHRAVVARALDNTRRTSAVIAAQGVAPEKVIELVVRNRNKPKERGESTYNLAVANPKSEPVWMYDAPAHLLAMKSPRPIDRIIEDQLTRNPVVRVTDVGGGYGKALRRVAPSTEEAYLERTLVDVIDWTTLMPPDFPPITVGGPRNTFRLLLADAITLTFPKNQLQHLILAVESIWYMSDKLAAIANLYNQLADDGILVIASMDPMQQFLETPDDGVDMADGFLTTLIEAGVHTMALTIPPFSPDIASLWIQKKPRTRMTALSPLIQARTTFHGATVSVYDPDFARAPVSIDRSQD